MTRICLHRGWCDGQAQKRGLWRELRVCHLSDFMPNRCSNYGRTIRQYSVSAPVSLEYHDFISNPYTLLTSWPSKGTCSGCMQQTDPSLCHFNQCAAAWMILLVIFTTHTQPPKKASLCCASFCNTLCCKSVLLWKQSQRWVQLNTVLANCLNPGFAPSR